MLTFKRDPLTEGSGRPDPIAVVAYQISFHSPRLSVQANDALPHLAFVSVLIE